MDKEKQFLKLLEENQQRIQKLCSMYAKTKENQKDLMQEVVLNIWKSFSSYRGEAALNTWVYRVILNVCLKKTYALKKEKTVPLEHLDFEPIHHAVNPTEKFSALRACIQQLDFSDRSIIILFLEELSYREIGKVIGISENYVAVKIKRIKKKLGICLNKKEI
ncbi:MAG: RNA polymerase sigma factor [Saprospiraceae bacterium]